MRQINFLIIFVMCLALVLFSLENTEPVAIRIVKDIQVQAPLSIELILAMGLGAVIAWIFGIWTKLQQQLESRQARRQLRSKEEQIEELALLLERQKLEREESSLPALAASETLAET